MTNDPNQNQPQYGEPAQYGDTPSYGDTPPSPSTPSPGDPSTQVPPPQYPVQPQDLSSQPTAFPPPGPPPQSRRSGLIALVVLLVIAVLIGGGFYLFRDRLSGSASDLAVGDCIDEPAGTQDIKEVQHQPCTDPHDGEVFAVVSHNAAPGAAYPDQAEFRDLAGDECVPLLQAYTGMDLLTFVAAGLDFSAFYPTAEAWNEGSRSVTCYLVKADNSKITGSLRGGAATPAP